MSSTTLYNCHRNGRARDRATIWLRNMQCPPCGVARSVIAVCLFGWLFVVIASSTSLSIESKLTADDSSAEAEADADAESEAQLVDILRNNVAINRNLKSTCKSQAKALSRVQCDKESLTPPLSVSMSLSSIARTSNKMANQTTRTQNSLHVPQAAGQVPPSSSFFFSSPQTNQTAAADSFQAQESNRSPQESDCALVLRRTYVIDKRTSDAWGERFVFNDADPDESKKEVRKSNVCIHFKDVDKAYQEAKHLLKFSKPHDIESRVGSATASSDDAATGATLAAEISDKSLGKLGELSLATTELLKRRFDLSSDELLNALPMIDMSASKLYWDSMCPQHLSAASSSASACSKSTKFRRITGHCNNAKHAAWGAVKTPYSRYLPPDYDDGLQLPRASRSGSPLPSARLISAQVHRDLDMASNDLTTLFSSWGQLLDHDMTRVAPGSAPPCCGSYLKGECFPIPVPANDPLYNAKEQKCLEFTRSLPAVKQKCLLGVRAQINTVTSPIDANFVYGSTDSAASKLRTFADGKLKVWHFFDSSLRLKPLLPPQLDKPDDDCVARPRGLFCFLAGDVRVNEQTHLTVLHTIYVREHNRLAARLAELNIEWDDERVYQETRAIVIAGVQHCLMAEYLPALLGEQLVGAYKLNAPSSHDASVTTATGTGFAAAAFRFGHSAVDGSISLHEPSGDNALIRAVPLRHLFKQPFLLFEPHVLDQLLAGLVNAPAQRTDAHVTRELSGHLFQPPGAKLGADLAAINIQRGRDNGVPSYTEWRQWCGLKRVRSFDELAPVLSERVAQHYASIYKHVDDIDLWSAGVSERRLPGAAVGPTFGCIIARQFANSRRGDRFWFDHQRGAAHLSSAQLAEIRKISLARLICINSDSVDTIQRHALRLPHPIYNERVKCSELGDIDLSPWRSEFR